MAEAPPARVTITFIRDRVAPDRKLGHIDRAAGSGAGEAGPEAS